MDGYLGNGILLKSVSPMLKVVDDDYLQLQQQQPDIYLSLKELHLLL